MILYFLISLFFATESAVTSECQENYRQNMIPVSINAYICYIVQRTLTEYCCGHLVIFPIYLICHDIVKNVHHSFCELEVTSSD